MMQQGLGALMPQQPAGQAPENPVRMAAAMDVVTSDAEEQVLDPRTLALIKYKDAVAAMQAADQLMAASQPTPTPPTVAERTKLAAQQGIMGLASRLAPGLQQQGNRMAQQEMGGGLPQLSAPNMAGMARGGIVGYADGGAVDTDVQRYTAQYRAIMAAIQNAGTPEQKAQLQQRLREIQSTFDPETIARAHMQMSGQGMADGGAVRGFAEGGGPNLFPSPADTVRAVGALPNIFPSPADTARAVAFLAEKGIDATKFTAEQIAEVIRNMDTFPGKEGMSAYGTVERPSIGELVRSGLGSLVPRGMSDEEIAAETAVTRRAAPRGMSDEEIESLLNTPRSGAGQAIFDTGEYIYENPVDAGLIALTASGLGAPLGIAGTALTRALPMLYRGAKAAMTPTGRAVIGGSGLALSNMFEGGGDEPAAATPTPQQPSVFDAGIDSQARPFRMLGVRDATTPTATTSAATTSAATAPTATTQDAVQMLLDKSPPAKAAAGAGQSRDSRDDRMRRIIAGLRGLGSQGVGGYAAGSAGEEQRLEQELIAEQERQRTAGMEERELGLRDREVTLLDALRRDQLEQEMTIENLRATIQREGYAAEASQALTNAINDLANKNNVTPQQVLTIAQRIVSDDLTGTKTLADAVQEVQDAYDASFGSSIIQGLRLAE